MKKIFIIFLLFIGSLFAQQNIDVYTYHNHAPFITDKNKGLSYHLINFLNKQTEQYKFQLKVIPRKRLNYHLKPWISKECGTIKKCSTNWMVLWVNHKWGFGKDSLNNFNWTQLFEDSNAIISSNKNKVIYENPSSLIGKKLAGVSGHRYVGIDDFVKQNKIQRIDGKNEKINLQKVLTQRVDVTLLPLSSFLYYQQQDSSLKELSHSKTAHQVYMRNIMTTIKNKQLNTFLQGLSFKDLLKDYAK